MGGSSTQYFTLADRVVRVSDIGLTRDSQWFGYIEDVRFYNSSSALNAQGPNAWVNVEAYQQLQLLQMFNIYSCYR